MPMPANLIESSSSLSNTVEHKLKEPALTEFIPRQQPALVLVR